MKILNRLLSTLLFGILLVGCENKDELDREKAENLLTEFYGFPSVEYAIHGSGYFDRFSLFNDECMRNNAEHCLSPETDELFFGIRELKGVTGITDTRMEGIKEVRYTIVRKQVTAAGNCMGYNENQEVELRIFIRKFDDGWRIDEERKLAILKPSDYPHLFK